jgi:ABC-type transporter Mla subunit MlaD
MTLPRDEDSSLRHWSSRLIQALQILDLEVDHEKIVQVADESAKAVGPHADAISAFIVGFAAGTASADGRKGARAAAEAASNKVLELCEHGESGGPDEKGWAKRAQ